MTLLSSVASADRNDASESTVILDSEGYEAEYLLTENGKDVQVWIESMEGVNGSSTHPIDVYIATSDEYFDHFCGCLLYTSPSPRDATLSRMPSSA